MRNEMGKDGRKRKQGTTEEKDKDTSKETRKERD